VFADALRGHNRARSAGYFEVVNLEAVVLEGGVPGAESLFIGYLVMVGIWRIEYNIVCREMRDWIGAGDSQC